MELFEELERIKIRFVAAYDKLVEQGSYRKGITKRSRRSSTI